MYKDKTILAMIPARGGSKGLPGKNIKPLMGKPLIAWTVEQAIASRYLDDVIVNTDDEQIASAAVEYGARLPFMRPAHLATDESPVMDSIIHALDQLELQGAKYDYLVLLEPTAPLREPDDIDNAVEKLIDNEHRADSIIAVGKLGANHPYLVRKIDSENYLRPFVLPRRRRDTRRQELPEAYIPCGIIYMSKVDVLRETRTWFYQDRTLPFVTLRWQDFAIDDEWDFLCVESILKQRSLQPSVC